MSSPAAVMSQPSSPTALPMSRQTSRRIVVVSSVVGLHLAGVWALQSGLLRRAVELVVPVEVMAEFIEAPQPQIPPSPPAPPAQTAPAPRPQPRVAPAPRPEPVASPSPTPSPLAPQVPPAEPVAAPAVAPAPPAPAAPPAPPAPPAVVLPSTNADYLNNPRPPYPALSRRLGEQGKVTLRVFIETDGTASRAEVRTSSGFERLDQAALQTVLRWRYVPGKRGGTPEAMWVTVPINFVLE